MKNKKQKLVVIGAGYSGINLVNKLSKNSNIEITLINKTQYHLHQTDIHKYISGQSKFEEVAFDLKKFAKTKKINFVEATVSDINFDEKIIMVNDEEIHYDYLTIATGNISFFPKQIKNIEEYAEDIKDVRILKEQREKFLNIIQNTAKQNKNIAIVGGGLSGVEIALEFAHVLKEKNISEKECSISLIEQLPDVLPNMDPFLVNKTREACDDLNIKRYHGAFVSEVKENTVFLSDSTTIPFDMILFVIGVSGEKLVEKDNVEINIKNQFVVDEYLRLENYKDVFVIGDIAQTKDKNGNYVLPTAQMAKLHANLTAKNIINTLKNKTLISNTCETKGVMVDLANKNCVGLLKKLKVKGFIAYNLKRFVSNQHMKNFK